jgi:4-azaleucine resistance transporter AzlC
MRKTIRSAFVRSVPVLAGYVVLGIGFGILLKKAGYGLFWSFLMGLTIYAGSMQYVGVSLLTSGASLITVALTTLMVNARHLFYGLTMIGRYEGAGKKKPYMIFALTDETYSLLCDGQAPEGVDRHWYGFFVSLFDQCYWVLGCALGSLVGEVLSFDTAGIDFSMTALFVTVFVEQWLTAKDHRPALLGLVCSVACLLIFGPGSFLIPTMISVTVVSLLLRRTLGGGGYDR